MRDMIVLLPGIMGSILEKDGKELWGLSFRAFWNALPSPHDALQHLKLQEDSPYDSDIGDGITATKLMPDAHLIPFFWKVDGYSSISNRINDYFEIIHGNIGDDKPANYFEFPYDWRRDNRYSARSLKTLVDQKLHLWRKHQPEAKVIFLAHSMGGIIARYYLEVLEGWQDCRALITFGTPYRGSIKVLDFLANGYENFVVNLSDVVRSFTSSYQLLPRYKMVDVGDAEYRRVAELDNIPNINKTRAVEALAFHHEFDKAIESHLRDENYRNSYKTIPIVGTKQKSLQSGIISEGKLTVNWTVPSYFDPLLEDGDGTVPRISGTPIEISEEYRDTFFPELHGSLQNNRQVLDALFERLKQMQIPGMKAIRGPEVDLAAAEKPAISLSVNDMYFNTESITVEVGLINSNEATKKVLVEVESTSTGKKETLGFEVRATNEVLNLGNLPADLYRLSVSTVNEGPTAPPSVHDIFEVAER